MFVDPSPHCPEIPLVADLKALQNCYEPCTKAPLLHFEETVANTEGVERRAGTEVECLSPPQCR